MKAVYIEKHGGVEVLTAGELPDPSVGPNEVKVRVRACAINRVDVYARAGVRGTRLPLNEPHVLGADVAGDIAEVGSEVTRVGPSERVVVNPRLTCVLASPCSARVCSASIAGVCAGTDNTSATNTATAATNRKLCVIDPPRLQRCDEDVDPTAGR